MADPNRPEDIASAAVKFDGDKTMYDLLPWDAIEELGKLYTKGAKKYAARNWEKGFRWGRTFAAMSRHAIAWFMAYVRGENGIDPETGLSHMVAVAWNALALVTFELRGVGVDDRPMAPVPAPAPVVFNPPLVWTPTPNGAGAAVTYPTTFRVTPAGASIPANAIPANAFAAPNGFPANTGAGAPEKIVEVSGTVGGVPCN
jgi:hypothetical protein